MPRGRAPTLMRRTLVYRLPRTNGAHLSQSCLLVSLSLQSWRKAMMIFRKLVKTAGGRKYAQIMANFSFMAARGLDTLIPFMCSRSRPLRPPGCLRCCVSRDTISTAEPRLLLLQPFDVSLTFILAGRINSLEVTAVW